MGLKNELRAFITAISEPGETKKNKEGLQRIFNKHAQRKGHCMFCGEKLKDESN